MKKIFIQIIGFFLLVSCSAPTATPNPAEVALTLLADKVNSEATQAVVNMRFTATAQIVGATATQQAQWVEATVTQQSRIDAQSTADKADANAQATADQERMDIQATQQRKDSDAATEQARLDAESTAEQARIDAQSTQYAAGTSTAFVITQTAIPPMNTMTAISQGQDIQLKDDQVHLSRLQVEQQEQKNTPQWVVPYVIGFLAMIGGLFYVWKTSKVRVEKDENGGVDILIIDGPHGPVAIRPRLFPTPVLEIPKDGEFNMPALVAPSEQAKVTERAQAVDAISKMPNNTTSQAAQTFNKYFGSQRQDLPFDVIDADDMPPVGLLNSESLKSLEKDWKEAKGE